MKVVHSSVCFVHITNHSPSLNHLERVMLGIHSLGRISIFLHMN